MNNSEINFHSAITILYVTDLAASLDYYKDKLGFKIDWGYQSVFASVSRGSATLMFCEGDQGNPGSWVYIGVGNCDELFEEFVSNGADVKLPPTNYSWAKEIHVADPD